VSSAPVEAWTGEARRGGCGGTAGWRVHGATEEGRGGGALDNIMASAGRGGHGAALSVRVGTCPRGRGRRMLGARLWRVCAGPAKTGLKASSWGRRRANVADGSAVVMAWLGVSASWLGSLARRAEDVASWWSRCGTAER
jgi:hypothetical protein